MPADLSPRFFTTADGLAHAYYQLGAPGADGVPILLQHGFTATTLSEWVDCDIAGRIAETLGRPVYGLDAIGHGHSDKPHDSTAYGENRMAADISALADLLGLTSFDFVGYSMGAIVGLCVGTSEPRLRRLVLGGIGEGVIEAGGVDTRQLDRGELAAGLRAADATGYAPLVQAMRAGIVARGGDLLAMAAHADAPQPRLGDLATIDAPTLLIAGDADPLALRPDRLAAAIPGCRLAIVGGDHTQARLDSRFTDEILAFLA